MRPALKHTGSLRRWQLRRLINRLSTGITTNVVYLGGSITAGTYITGGSINSWRWRTKLWLDEFFTASNLTHYNAGVGGTPSWYGLVRLQTDVLDYNPELVFIDFAVNDNGAQAIGDRTNGFAPAAEALMRRLRSSLPNATLIVQDFIWPQSYSYFGNNERLAAEKWSVLARWYCAPTFRLDDIIEQVLGTHTPSDAQVETYWESPGSVHPNYDAHLLIFQNLQRYLMTRQVDAVTAKTWQSTLPDRYYSEAADYEQTPTIRNGTNNDGTTGTWTPNGSSIVSSEVDATVQFSGTFCSFGLDTNYGAGAGVIAWSVDGGPETIKDFTTETNNIEAISNFTRGVHTITLRVVSGTVQINRFLAV